MGANAGAALREYVRRAAFLGRSRWRFWREYYITGERELALLYQFVPPEAAALDVGANDGVYTYQLSRLARCVIAFEPNPTCVERLQRLAMRNATVEAVALSDRQGNAHLNFPISPKGIEETGMASIEPGAVSAPLIARSIAVPTQRLDDYRLTDVGFIKIDVEGHEESVLIGAKATLEACRPVLLIEIEERHNAGGLGRIKAMLGSLGYQGSYFTASGRMNIENFRPDRDQHVEVLAAMSGNRRSVPYINNFLFTPKHRDAP